VETRRF
jgi:hypothetical protein